MIRSSRLPKTCRQVGRVIQSYLDDELDGERREAVERHLEACRDCGLDAESFDRLKAAIGRLQPVDDDLVNRLREFGSVLASGDHEGPRGDSANP